jgi:hypothetical protein
MPKRMIRVVWARFVITRQKKPRCRHCAMLYHCVVVSCHCGGGGENGRCVVGVRWWCHQPDGRYRIKN